MAPSTTPLRFRPHLFRWIEDDTNWVALKGLEGKSRTAFLKALMKRLEHEVDYTGNVDTGTLREGLGRVCNMLHLVFPVFVEQYDDKLSDANKFALLVHLAERDNFNDALHGISLTQNGRFFWKTSVLPQLKQNMDNLQMKENRQELVQGNLDRHLQFVKYGTKETARGLIVDFSLLPLKTAKQKEFLKKVHEETEDDPEAVSEILQLLKDRRVRANLPLDLALAARAQDKKRKAAKATSSAPESPQAAKPAPKPAKRRKQKTYGSKRPALDWDAL